MASGYGCHDSSILRGDLPRTLYVGNLSQEVTEELLLQVFVQFGTVKSCKIIREPNQDPYAFVEFNGSAEAQAAMAMNKIVLLDKELRVNWATSGQHPARAAETKWNPRTEHFPIFVGDLSPDIDDQQLKQCFSTFGEIADVKIVRDPHTLKSKGYGFVAYLRKPDAENAIHSMNGQWLGARAIRTNWATRKPVQGGMRETQKLNFEEVYGQSSPANMTVYVGNNLQGLSEQFIRDRMEHFGPIVEIRVFKEKGYAFCRFSNKMAATNAICELNGEDFNGQTIKCAWGKESGDMSGGGIPNNIGGMQSVSPMMGGRTNYGMQNSQGVAAMSQVQQQYSMQQQPQQPQHPQQQAQPQQPQQQVAYAAYGSPYASYYQYAAYAASPEWQQQMQQWQQYYNAYSQQPPGMAASPTSAVTGWGAPQPSGYQQTATNGAAVGGSAAPQHYE